MNEILSTTENLIRRREMSDKDRDKALENAIAQIDRQFGKGSIMKMSDYGAKMQVESIPTGSIALDMAPGGGGVPRGRMIEIYGPESSGKTTLTYHIMAEAQKIGGVSAYIDAEHAFDPEYAARCGLNLDQLLISQPDHGEQALEIAETLVRSGAIDVIVVKNKVAPPFRTAEFDIMFNEGISRICSRVDLGTELNVLRKSGVFYTF